MISSWDISFFIWRSRLYLHVQFHFAHLWSLFSAFRIHSLVFPSLFPPCLSNTIVYQQVLIAGKGAAGAFERSLLAIPLMIFLVFPHVIKQMATPMWHSCFFFATAPQMAQLVLVSTVTFLLSCFCKSKNLSTDFEHTFLFLTPSYHVGFLSFFE